MEKKRIVMLRIMGIETLQVGIMFVALMRTEVNAIGR